MGWFKQKTQSKALDLLTRKKKTTNEEKEKVIRCCICGKVLEEEYEEGPEYDDGTDDIYDVCWNCSGKFERWLKEKHRKEEEECL